MVNHQAAPPLERGQFTERYLDGQTMFSLINYDPDHKPEIRPFRQHGVVAKMGPQSRRRMDVFGNYYLMRGLRLTGDDDERSLSELVEESQVAFGEQGPCWLAKRR
jgi:hypothetical protein